MKQLLKYKKWLLLIADLLLVPGLLLCRWLSARMLAGDAECPWALVGGQCITCGGTRFVHALTGGDLAQALQYNPFLFALTVFFALSWVLLHLHWLGKIPFAARALRRMYSYRVLIAWIVVMGIFFLVRNLPFLIRLIQFLQTAI